MIPRWANRLLLILNLAMISVCLAFIVTRGLSPSPTWTYQDLVTTLLTALAALLALVTIVLALAAFWGYNAIREGSHKIAQSVAEQIATDVARSAAADVARAAVPREVDAAVRLHLGVGSQEPSASEPSVADALRTKDEGGAHDGA